jgi:hypothetical protein
VSRAKEEDMFGWFGGARRREAELDAAYAAGQAAGYRWRQAEEAAWDALAATGQPVHAAELAQAAQAVWDQWAAQEADDARAAQRASTEEADDMLHVRLSHERWGS